MMNYFLDPLKKYADFTGRASKTEYWMFILFYTVIYIALVAIDYATGMGVLSLIYSLALLVPSVSVATRRLHDIDRSGWWQLIVLIPLIGIIVILVFMAQDSDPETNQYGEKPII
jgi:uncharacterized membrane protein YhaH (DUF805 family)